MNGKQSRRDFLKFVAGAGLTLAACAKTSPVTGNIPSTGFPLPTGTVYLPYIHNQDKTVTFDRSSKVIHIHALAATTWTNLADPQYWKYTNQNAVSAMVERGLIELTGQTSPANAWRVLLPNYQSGQKIAIKINCNSVSGFADVDEDIESTPQPVNGVIATLKAAGVQERDIWVYDAMRPIPDRIFNPIHQLFPAVSFYCAKDGSGYLPSTRTFAAFTKGNAVQFHPPAGIPAPGEILLSDVVVNASYIINMPILKRHSLPGVTLGFKHHFGSINHPSALHSYIQAQGGANFSTGYSVLVDLYKSPHIGPKTVISIADGLFGYRGSANGGPTPWNTFGNKPPNSLFFSVDPVALDSVLCDFLAFETGDLPTTADVYLPLAKNAGLGVYERGNPWGSGYRLINYHKVEL